MLYDEKTKWLVCMLCATQLVFLFCLLSLLFTFRPPSLSQPSSSSVARPATAYGAMADPLERCMHCFRDFPLSELVSHASRCDGEMLGTKERYKDFLPSAHDVSSWVCDAWNANFIRNSGRALTWALLLVLWSCRANTGNAVTLSKSLMKGYTRLNVGLTRESIYPKIVWLSPQ